MNATKIFAATAAIAAATTASLSDTLTWNGGTSGVWDTTTQCWKNGAGNTVAWTDGNDAVFPEVSTTANPAIEISGTRTAGNVTVGGPKKYNFSGGILKVDGKFTANVSVGFDGTSGFEGSSVRVGGTADKVVSAYGTGNAQSKTLLEDKIVFGAKDDGSSSKISFGPIPAQPSENIVVLSGEPCIYFDYESALHENRGIGIRAGAILKLASVSGESAVKGVIAGAPDATLGFATNAQVTVYHNSSWNGTIAFDPGIGRTNDVGILRVEKRLRIASGTTRIGSARERASESTNEAGAGDATLFIRTSSNNGYSESQGNLVIDGATLYDSQSNRCVVAGYYGQVTLTNTAVVNTPGVDWVLGHSGPAKLSVLDGSSMFVHDLWLSKNNGTGTEITLADGALLSARRLGLFPASTSGLKCRFLFNGGRLQSSEGNGSFLGSLNTGVALSETDWANVSFIIGEKGAVFDAGNGKNIHWSRPLVSGAGAGETDGGVRIFSNADNRGLVLYKACSYNGPTVVDGGMLQCRVDNTLPTGSSLRLANGGTVHFYDYTSTFFAQNLGRIEGDGKVLYPQNITVDGSIRTRRRWDARLQPALLPFRRFRDSRRCFGMRTSEGRVGPEHCWPDAQGGRHGADERKRQSEILQNCRGRLRPLRRVLSCVGFPI